MKVLVLITLISTLRLVHTRTILPKIAPTSTTTTTTTSTWWVVGYCTQNKPCSENQGDCDSDNECKAGLLCGKNNCPKNLGYEIWVDCCYSPSPGLDMSCTGSSGTCLNCFYSLMYFSTLFHSTVGKNSHFWRIKICQKLKFHDLKVA